MTPERDISFESNFTTTNYPINTIRPRRRVGSFGVADL